MPLTVWVNTEFSPVATRMLHTGLSGHRLVQSPYSNASVLVAGKSDPTLAEADVAFGQPDETDCLRQKRLRWVEVSTAGYTRYDTDRFREGWRARGAVFTNASGVFADPCAQHVLAMMLAGGRQLLASYRDQLTDQSWHYTERRYHSKLLTGQTVLMLGYGAIGRRLTELLAPFGCSLFAMRRQSRSESGVRIVPVEEMTRVLPLADHIVNILPDNEATRGFVNSRRLACCKPGARFYNVGRGVTVDENALLDALNNGRLGMAYLDVAQTEPLPSGHPLWSAPNCYITPHTAGGRADQDEALVRHFLDNLIAFENSGQMTDRII